MISAGCIIEGEVVNSVLSPGVVVRAGASVRDSIVFSDCVIEKGAVVELAILDKRVRVGGGALIGFGEDHHQPNHLHPKHLYTGITLVGKKAFVGEKSVVGRNCILLPDSLLESGEVVKSGETV